MAQDLSSSAPGAKPPASVGKPEEAVLKSAGSTRLDLRNIPRQKPRIRIRPERRPPPLNPVELPGSATPAPASPAGPAAGPAAPAPAPIDDFAGLNLASWGSGWPPDTVGDVGPTYYIQMVNSSVGVFDKSTGTLVAAFTLDSFFSLGSYGNLCDTDNFGDPVVLYDSFEDRWVVSDFAFQLDHSNNVVNPPGAFECIAVSKSGDPVSGGWNFYYLNFTDGLNDYPKLGVWPDGIYMAANMFDFAASGNFQNSRVWALNKLQMYAGDTNVQVVQFDAPAGEFTLLPANARLQAGTPPLGAPNYFAVVWKYSNAISFYKFHVDWDSISLSSFTGPFTSTAPSSWSVAPDTVPAQGGVNIDTLTPRLMMQNQYSNVGGVESLWNTHTVLGGAPGTAAPRFYQVEVTGDSVAANTTQAATDTPDTSVDRFMPSLAVNRDGDMAIGYSASSSALYPAIRYAGRLASDTAGTLPQTEQSLIEGSGSQTTYSRWGDYSAMSLDPDGCTFWYTNEYYATTGTNWQTRIGSFALPGCATVSTGTLEGTVTAASGGAAIAGAAVALGSRSTTTDGSGFYRFSSLPSGTYPQIDVSAPAYVAQSSSPVVVADGGTTTLNFSLDSAPASACPVDTSQADFEAGVPSGVDLTASPGAVKLEASEGVDQQNTSLGKFGTGFNSTTWAGQTFTAGVSGELTAVDVALFCSNCSGTTPGITVSIRAVSGDLPTGPDLATGSIPGFSSGATNYYKAALSAPVSISSGTRYAIVVRVVSNPSAGSYAFTRSNNANAYANGQGATSGDSGGTWSGQSYDFGFHVYVKSGYVGSGSLISSLKDSNPAAGTTPQWSTLSWNGSTPSGTTLRFQAAGSNASTGPFDFVGPDGTAGTYYTSSGGSLSQFDGNRYLEYKAFLSTTDSAATPTLNDVTLCYDNVQVSDVTLSKGASPSTYDTVGQTISYTYDVGNAGGTVLAGPVTVADDKVTVSCPALTTVGNNDGNLDPGESVQCTASHTVVQADIDAGSIVNHATATVDSADSNQDSATVTSTATPLSADLAISKTDNIDSVAPGGANSYTIIAANNGPDGVNDARVTDNFPASLSCTYTSVAGTGVSGNTASGTGDIDDTLTLPAGASAIYTANCDVAGGASGVLSNTAAISSSAGDSAAGNNSATDTTSVVNCSYSVSQPAGGETWRQGEIHDINWSGSGDGCAATVDIELYKAGVLNRTIAAGTSDTSYSWIVPSDQTTGSDYRVRITDSVAPDIYGESAADFTIDAATCNNNVFSGVTETGNGTYEACDTLTVGPDFTAGTGASVFFSSGLDILFMPGFVVQSGATINADVCGQSLCQSSSQPMPQGCHSCVVQICDIDPACCGTAWDQSCVDKVASVCGLTCQ